MKSFKFLSNTKINCMALASLLLITIAVLWSSLYESQKRFSYIVQGASKPTLINAVESVGGEVLHKYTVIQAISALMTDAQVNRVRNAHPMIRLFNDGKVQLSNTTFAYSETGEKLDDERNTYVSTLTGASQLHQQGITGKGVGVAIIDTGIRTLKGIKDNTRGERNIVVHNVLSDTENKHDANGHGTHIASIISNSDYSYDQAGNQLPYYNGIAPDADLLVVKAFNEDGSSTYAHILAALDYVIAHKDEHNIKVLNLSFSANPQSYYFDDPINQAVSLAWSQGITVLASAGNQGALPMSIGVPGNNPYVITVGASSDNGTPYYLGDDTLTAFSSAGPTVAGFIKPEIIAPGSKIQGAMSESSFIKQNYPGADAGNNYAAISGTSQSTAVTTGVVALLLQNDPTLTPDDVKCRLLSSAIAGLDENSGAFTYSIFQQGAGMVNAERALNSTAQNCANLGLDIQQTLIATSKEQHYVGPARYNFDTEQFYLEGSDAHVWDGTYTNGHLWPDKGVGGNTNWWPEDEFAAAGHLWPDKGVGTNGHLWPDKGVGTNGHLWPDKGVGTNGHLWPDKGVGTNGHLWPDKGVGSIQSWSSQTLSNSAVVNSWFVE